jgi:hypothetical protein
MGAGVGAKFHTWVYTRTDPYYVGVGAGVHFNPWMTHGPEIIIYIYIFL